MTCSLCSKSFGGVCSKHAGPELTVPSAATSKVDTNPKTAFGAVKAPMGLIPVSALVHEAEVFRLGAKKYGPLNWRKNPVSASTYLDASFRHWALFLDGQDNDPESGASHLAHVRACMAILIDAKEHGTLIDDRPTPGPGAAVMDRFHAQRQAEKAAGK